MKYDKKYYSYELWDGKKSHGDFVTSAEIKGNHVIIPEYNSRKVIKLKIKTRIIIYDRIKYTVIIYLDVRRKSKRQIEMIKKQSLFP